MSEEELKSLKSEYHKLRDVYYRLSPIVKDSHRKAALKYYYKNKGKKSGEVKLLEEYDVNDEEN
jgi:hypothetical protein